MDLIFLLGSSFGRRRAAFFDDFEGYGYDPWAHRAEKSAAARRREGEATSKFDHLRCQVDLALYEHVRTAIGLGCLPRSSSPLRLLGPDVLDQVLAYAGLTRPEGAGVRAAAAARGAGKAIVPFEGWRGRKGRPEEDGEALDLSDAGLFRPGEKIVFPLTKPNLHLTGPCYRVSSRTDFRKHVRDYKNWDVQRTAATPQQKREYRQTRQGKVFFINVVYKVPGRPGGGGGKRKRGTVAAAAKVGTSSTGTARKTSPAARGKATRARKAAAPPPPATTLSPGTQARASSALDAAVRSAAIDAEGIVDPEVLRRAIDVGYSKHFVLGKVAALESVRDTKPPAKKRRG